MAISPEDIQLHEHGTKLNGLKPINIIQAAEADLRLKQRKKEKQKDANEMYLFARKHVNRANGVGMLIALAYFEPDAAHSTDKKSTYIVYSDRDLLRQALLFCLESGA